MTRLSDTQTITFSAASQRPDGNLLPLPGSLRGGAAAKVVAALLARGLIREEVTDSKQAADTALHRPANRAYRRMLVALLLGRSTRSGRDLPFVPLTWRDGLGPSSH